jgi:hypothetical protein
MTASLDQLLDDISVLECDEMNVALSVAHDATHSDDTGGAHHPHPPGWYGVCDDDGVRAYFHNQTDAFRYRLDLINRRLNP